MSTKTLNVIIDLITEMLDDCNWKVIPGLGNYMISRFGQVRQIEDENGVCFRIVPIHVNDNGYLTVTSKEPEEIKAINKVLRNYDSCDSLHNMVKNTKKVKITESLMLEVRVLLDAGVAIEAIAENYNITTDQVSKISADRIW